MTAHLATLFCLLLWPFTAARAAVLVTSLPFPIQIDWKNQTGPIIDLTGVSETLDLDGDGSVDFRFGSSDGFASVQSQRANRVLYLISSLPNIGGPVAPISIGDIIGVPFGDIRFGWSSTDFVDGFTEPNEVGTAGTLALQVSSGWASAFPEFGLRAPIGVEFLAPDGVHYGYIDVFVGGRFDSLVVHGWAYESVPGMPIQASLIPEPGTTVLIGSSAFLLWQRNTNTRKENKALQRTARGLFVSMLYLIRKCLGFGRAQPRP
jgi:hypothetical protein